MRVVTMAAVACLGIGLAGCGDTTASRSLSGGALGAGGGAIIGAIAGSDRWRRRPAGRLSLRSAQKRQHRLT